MKTKEFSCARVTIKKFDHEKREITGIATTPEADRMGDEVNPMGVYNGRLPIPLLMNHDPESPVGLVTHAKATPDGIEFKATIAKEDAPGILKDRVDLAWQSVKNGLLGWVSIGFKALERTKNAFGGYKIDRWDWVELSLVTTPAHAGATITSFKDYDRSLRAALGTSASDGNKDRGGVALQTSKNSNTKDDKMDIVKQLETLKAARVEKNTAAEAIQTAAIKRGETKSAEEGETFSTLISEIQNIDNEIKDLETLQSLTSTKAVPVPKDIQNGEDAAKARDTKAAPAFAAATVLGPNTEPGIAMAQAVVCMHEAGYNKHLAANFAREHYSDDGRIAKFFEGKAAVPAANTGANGWGGYLAEPQMLENDFIEYLRPRSFIDRVGTGGTPSFRRAPFNTEIGRQTTGTDGYWVDEGKPAPLTEGVFDKVTMTKKKVASIVVFTDEQLRFTSGPSALDIIRRDLAKGMGKRMDLKALSADAATSAAPAGFLNGLSAITPNGTGTADDVRSDIQDLYEPFADAEISSAEIAMVTNEKLLHAAKLFKTAVGPREFPDLTRDGGEIEDYPILGTNYAGAGDVIMFAPDHILFADDGDFDISMSREASLEMLDGSLVQDGTVGTGASLVNLWQSGLVGLKLTRFVDWTLARSGAVSFIGAAGWNGAPSA